MRQQEGVIVFSTEEIINNESKDTSAQDNSTVFTTNNKRLKFNIELHNEAVKNITGIDCDDFKNITTDKVKSILYKNIFTIKMQPEDYDI